MCKKLLTRHPGCILYGQYAIVPDSGPFSCHDLAKADESTRTQTPGLSRISIWSFIPCRMSIRSSILERLARVVFRGGGKASCLSACRIVSSFSDWLASQGFEKWQPEFQKAEPIQLAGKVHCCSIRTWSLLRIGADFSGPFFSMQSRRRSLLQRWQIRLLKKSRPMRR